MFRTVFGDHHDAVAGPHVQCPQLGFGLIAQVGDIGKAEAAFGKDDEGGVGPLLQAAVKQVVDAHCHAQLTSMPLVTVAHMARSLAARSLSS